MVDELGSDGNKAVLKETVSEVRLVITNATFLTNTPTVKV